MKFMDAVRIVTGLDVSTNTIPSPPLRGLSMINYNNWIIMIILCLIIGTCLNTMYLFSSAHGRINGQLEDDCLDCVRWSRVNNEMYKTL